MRHFATASALLRASHPLPALAVTAIAAGLAAAVSGAPLGVAAAVLPGQLSVGWLNDLVDADRDARVGRPGKPVASGAVSRRAVLVAVVISALAAVVLSLPFGVAATAAHLVALGSAWAYDLGLKATAFSVLPYAVSFGLLPVFVTLGGGMAPPSWLVPAAALLGAAAHFVNVLPDLADDAATGVRGLPHRLGAVKSTAVASVLVLATAALLVLGPVGLSAGLLLLALAVALLSTGLVLGRRPGSRAAFRAVILVALLDVAVLLGSGIPPG
ncbi:4-hydroxybenzoate polyprenyltransferase [Saccharopolyspora antimicrobica]|uniref:4-hydroxybenzoate polyprenyltransferase n=1 Tax=Saccharopolyspora antimicrobica TaxID=455193 RepID=A0A1I4QTP1_9PSEU|nr:UbiA family prenyltransferase [Saccharopolyspora antimicrobica]RKT88312.1 4-hydroxybenzoate polyprenyltransferase [Saccharopolyspora antimicrobica]SFM43066.1 4-hydroxybenzoate polyprenyltransferase [Saccharopolyspora antimicrobica]